jgi:DNA-binding SARP family transcriptional activator
VCTAALGIDAYHDPIWRLLVEARERAGDWAAAASARASYTRMLADLGVPEDPASDRSAAGARSDPRPRQDRVVEGAPITSRPGTRSR